MPQYHSLSDELVKQIEADRIAHKDNPYAAKHSDSVRRYNSSNYSNIWRPNFCMDVDKVLHNNYYNRYSDKTQVVSFYKNDDISRRALHVQLVSRIARTIGMNLNLNLDLIEAISLGHDIGHTPFGHVGERYLSELYHAETGRLFNHNVHSVRVLDKLICRNISLQVLDGALCHNGEMEQQEYRPRSIVSFEDYDSRVESCYVDPAANKQQIPCTLEGCVMRISDIIAYLGKDRQDAMRLGFIDSTDTFSEGPLGTSNAEIINNMTVSIIEHSYGKPYISMDKDTFEALSLAKKENYEQIYNHKSFEDVYEGKIKPMFHDLYYELLEQAKAMNEASILYQHHIEYIRKANQHASYFDIDTFMDEYKNSNPNDIVVDFIASMTDDYFIDLYHHLFPTKQYEINYVGYFD